MKLDMLNNLLEIAEFVPVEIISKKDVSYKIYELVNNPIGFVGGNKTLHEKLLDDLYSDDQEIYSTISKKKFVNIIIDKVKEKKKTGGKFSKDEIVLINSELMSIPLSSYIIIRDIVGVQTVDRGNVFVTSNIKIYDWNSNKNLIENKFPQNPEVLWLDTKHGYVIEITVMARDEQKALENADAYFEFIQCMFHVVLGSTDKKYFVGITELNASPYSSIHWFNETTKNVGGKFGRDYIWEAIPLDDPYFNSEDSKKIYNILNGTNTEFLKKLFLSIHWLGKAYRSPDIRTGFLSAAISLEVLFTYNEKSIITPSILYQISESVACILGQNSKNRLEIEKEIKDLYGMRSSICHSGSSSLEDHHYNALCSYSRNIIYELLSEKYKDIKSISNLYEYLKTLKYSFAI